MTYNESTLDRYFLHTSILFLLNIFASIFENRRKPDTEKKYGTAKLVIVSNNRCTTIDCML